MGTTMSALRQWAGVLLACGIIGISGGCASTPPPRETIGQAELAVTEAGQGKAPQYAAPELSKARSKLDEAKRAMDAERYIEARRLAEQALVDAQLAAAKAQAEEQRQTLQELRKSIEALQEEAVRATGSQ